MLEPCRRLIRGPPCETQTWCVARSSKECGPIWGAAGAGRGRRAPARAGRTPHRWVCGRRGYRRRPGKHLIPVRHATPRRHLQLPPAARPGHARSFRGDRRLRRGTPDLRGARRLPALGKRHLRHGAASRAELDGERGRHRVDLPAAARRQVPGAGEPRGHGGRHRGRLPLRRRCREQVDRRLHVRDPDRHRRVRPRCATG